MKPRLPWQVATRPLTAEDGWRAPSTQEASVHINIYLYVYIYIYSWHVKQFHIYIALASCYLSMFD